MGSTRPDEGRSRKNMGNEIKLWRFAEQIATFGGCVLGGYAIPIPFRQHLWDLPGINLPINNVPATVLHGASGA